MVNEKIRVNRISSISTATEQTRIPAYILAGAGVASGSAKCGDPECRARNGGRDVLILTPPRLLCNRFHAASLEETRPSHSRMLPQTLSDGRPRENSDLLEEASDPYPVILRAAKNLRKIRRREILRGAQDENRAEAAIRF